MAAKLDGLREVALQEAPHQHLHQRPVDELGGARPGRADHVPVAQHQAEDAPSGGGDASSARAPATSDARSAACAHGAPSACPRCRGARWRGTPPPDWLRPKRLISSSRRLVGDDAALLQHDHPVGQALHLGHVVGGEHDGGAACPAIELELGAHPVGGVGIERGGGLVEHQQLGLVEQRLGEAHARLLPGRELAVGPVEQVGEPELLGDRRRCAPLRSRTP